MTAQRRDTSINLYFPHKGLHINSVALAGESTASDQFLESIRKIVLWWYQDNSSMEVITSGSTGNPRTIRFNRAQIQGSVLRTASALGLNHSKKALLCIDPQYIGGRMMLLRALELGMDMICVEPNSNPFLNNLPTCDFTALVPLQVESILSNPITASRFKSVEIVLIGGAPINPTLEKKLSGLPNRVYQTYGMTETLSHIALRSLSNGERDFTALPEITITEDERDCLIAAIPDFGFPVVTNDLIELTSTNRFRWLGRYDNVINSGGVKVLPETLESKLSDVLKKFTAITGFFLAGSPDERLGERVTLVIECQRENIPDRESLIDCIRAVVTRFEIPREIRCIDAFIKTPGGKLDRRTTLAKSQLLEQAGPNPGGLIAAP